MYSRHADCLSVDVGAHTVASQEGVVCSDPRIGRRKSVLQADSQAVHETEELDGHMTKLWTVVIPLRLFVSLKLRGRHSSSFTVTTVDSALIAIGELLKT